MTSCDEIHKSKFCQIFQNTNSKYHVKGLVKHSAIVLVKLQKHVHNKSYEKIHFWTFMPWCIIHMYIHTVCR